MKPIGLTRKEVGDYSLIKAVAALAAGRPLQQAAPFEYACSKAARGDAPQRNDGSPWGQITVPADVLFGPGRRDLVTTTASAGGFLVGTTVPPFARALNHASWLEVLPVTRVEDAADNFGIPRNLGNISTDWLSTENAAPTERDFVFGQTALAPKTVAVGVERSQLHLKQGAPQEALLMAELGAAVGFAVAAGCANGSGASGQPTGILSRIGQNVSGTSLSWTNLSDLIRQVEAAGASNLRVLIGTSAARILRNREKFTGAGSIMAGGQIDGFPVTVTNSMPADALIVGDFSQVVFASYGPGLEIAVANNATSSNFAAGITTIRALWSLDVNLLQASGLGRVTGIT